MKRYAVFATYTYYPGGGMSDFQKSFDSFDEACLYKEELESEYDNVSVDDMESYD